MTALPQTEPRLADAPPTPTRRDWLTRLWTGFTTGPYVTPLAIAAGARVALYVLLIVFVGLLPGEPETKPNFWQALTQWDGEWYRRIAVEGYHWPGPTVQSSVAFFPLYPLLARAVGAPFGHVEAGLFLVANLSFVLFIYYLYRLAELDFDRMTAERAAVYAAVFPGAFVLGAFYAEPTSFALATASFYYARKGAFRWAIALGFLTTLTRLPGIAIFLPVAWEYFRQRGVRWQMLSLGFIPLGLAAFALYVASLSGDLFTVLTVQQTAWFRSFTPPWETLQMAIDRALWPWTHYVVSVNLLDAGTILLFAALTLFAMVRMPASYWLYALPILLGALSQTVDPDKAPPTAAITRYLMAIFPGYIALARVARNAYLDQAVRWTFALLMGVFAIYFFARFWVL